MLSKYTLPGLALLFLTLGCAAIGFTDDYLKVRKRSLGLSGRWKMLAARRRSRSASLLVANHRHLDTEIYFPIVDVNIDLGWFCFPFLFIVIAGTANGVNLTDGIDGLAAGTGDLAAHLPRDAGDLVDPLGTTSGTAATTTSTSRSSPPR